MITRRYADARHKASNLQRIKRGKSAASLLVQICLIFVISTVPSMQVSAAPLIQSVFRTYSPSSIVTPGGALGSTDSTVVLPGIANQFRVRAGLTNPSTPSQLGINQISGGGYNHMCAMASDGNAYCWGMNNFGQLGDGTLDNSALPVPVLLTGGLAGKTILSITAGYEHTCAIASDHQAYCWGRNGDGQMGIGSNSGTTPQGPTAVVTSGVLSGKTIKSLSAGYNSTCAIASDDLAYCWGSNASRQVGNNSTSRALSPAAVVTAAPSGLNGKTVKALSVSYRHVCAIASDDLVYCWGEGGSGQLGSGDTSGSDAPVPVAVSTTAPSSLNGKTIKDISSGGSHTCVVASDGTVHCWGQGTRGQLGDGLGANSPIPVAVSTSGVLSGEDIAVVSTGSAYSCSLSSEGYVNCWGNGGYGQLGNGGGGDQMVPVAFTATGALGSRTIKRLTTSHSSVCAIASDDKAYCWGNGEEGQMGDGDFSNNYGAMSVDSSIWSVGPVTVAASSTDLQLEYAHKASYSTCSAIPNASWSPVTSVSAISYDNIAPNDAQAISPFANDPTIPGMSTGYDYQSIVRGTTSSAHTFTNSSEITAGQTGLWDFVLRDRTAISNGSYCLRIVTASGSASGHTVDEYSVYPEVTTAMGSLGIRFVDGSANSIFNPTTTFSGLMSLSNNQTSSAVLLDSSSRQLEIANSYSNTGWSVTLAATAGPSATWQSGNNSYLYNGTASTGQLSVDMSSSSFVAGGTTPSGTACSTTGLSIGTSASYDGSTSSISLASGSSASGFNCIFTLRSIDLYQSVPAHQPGGTYTLPMTVTVMAQ